MAASEAEASWQPDAAQLMKRLEAAERVCVLFGWTAASSGTDLDKALHELWAEWVAVAGTAFAGPSAHPELSGERIAELARRRDLTRQRTLDAIRAGEADGG
jgi:hypothetical protein